MSRNIITAGGGSNSQSYSSMWGQLSPIPLSTFSGLNFVSEGDLATGTVNNIKVGHRVDCSYSGTYKSITLSPGTYIFECWGACGGRESGSAGSRGGYAIGEIAIAKEKTFYCYVGGKGEYATTSAPAGGWNGGGSGTTGGSYRNYAGGGGTDISALGGDWDSTNHLYSRIIVAGGGGGGRPENEAAVPVDWSYGGGYTGGNGYQNGEDEWGRPGTQTAGGQNAPTRLTNHIRHGEFGKGGCANRASWGDGCGGGGWYGGGSGNDTGSGGGGSGYVYTELHSTNYPSGCKLTHDEGLSSDSFLIAGNKAIPSPTVLGATEMGHDGHGFIRISRIK